MLLPSVFFFVRFDNKIKGGGHFMARDNTQPMVFELPDGDTVALITWDYVMKKLDEELTPVVESMSKINSYLERIDDRVQYWLDSQKEDDEGNDS